jgi:hypothetical protein
MNPPAPNLPMTPPKPQEVVGGFFSVEMPEDVGTDGGRGTSDTRVIVWIECGLRNFSARKLRHISAGTGTLNLRGNSGVFDWTVPRISSSTLQPGQ